MNNKMPGLAAHKKISLDEWLLAAAWIMLCIAPVLWFSTTVTNLVAQTLQASILILHPLLEIFAIVVCASIFVVGWHGLDDRRPRASVLMALAFLLTGMLTTFHMLSHTAGFSVNGLAAGHLSQQFWALARISAASGMIAYLLPQFSTTDAWPDDMRYLLLAASLVLLTVVVWLVMHSHPDQGVMAPVGISAMLLLMYAAALWLSIGQWRAEDSSVTGGLPLALCLLIAGEIFFLVMGLGDDTNAFLGLFYTATAYMFVYRGTFLNSIRLPVKRLRQAHQEMSQYVSQLDNLLMNAPDGIVGVNEHGVIRFVNPQVSVMFGYSPEELIGQEVEILLPLRLRDMHAGLRGRFSYQPSGRPMSALRGLCARRKDGVELPVDIALGFHKSGEVTHFTAFIRDVSERHRLEQEMQHRANHDGLTGLPNRTLLRDRLERHLIEARRHGTLVALVLVDLDNFKEVNDGWGHGYGDQLLINVSRRLSRALREGDTVCRLGGDEFVVLAPALTSPDDTSQVVERIIAALDHVFMIGDIQFRVTASVGVALFPQHALDAESLLSKADIAMYHAKFSGGKIFSIYSEQMGARQQQNMVLKSRLMTAMANDELTLHFQPQYRISDKSIVGFEALLRWYHPESGWVPPDTFIPVAESCGLIVPMTEWILQHVVAQIRIWSDMGLPTRVSVNISALHFRKDCGLCDFIGDLLASSGIEPSLLGLELTESVLMDDPETVRGILNRIVALGCHVSIDDFGIGYSSLASLQLYPLHTLKIDRSFVRNVSADAKSASIVRGLVTLASCLGMEVMAEGVETPEQLEVLRNCDCDSIQGWLMHPALPSIDCTRLMLAARDSATSSVVAVQFR